jgi:hypothetical protein
MFYRIARTIVLMLLLRYKSLSAFPTGVGSCGAGSFAVAGIHRSRGTIVNATFAETGIVLTFGGNSYLPGSVIPLLPGVEYILSVETNGEAFFRGILIRFQSLERQDLSASLAPKQNTALTNYCRPPYVAGLSHTDSTIKGTASGRFFSNSPGRIRLEINVVIANEPELSMWGYANFTIDVADIGLQFAPSTFAPITPIAPIASAYASAPTAVTPTYVPPPIPASTPIYVAPTSSGQTYFVRQDDF